MTVMSDIRSAFKAAVVLASELDSSAICWGDAEGIAADPVIVLTQVTSTECTPWCEELSGTGDQTRVLSQWRQITFQVRVETVNGDLLYDASDLAQETLLGLHRIGARTALAAAGYGVLVDAPSAIRAMHYRYDDRLVHAWSFDAIVRARLTRSDPTTVGTITSAEATGDLLSPPSTHITVETISP